MLENENDDMHNVTPETLYIWQAWRAPANDQQNHGREALESPSCAYDWSS